MNRRELMLAGAALATGSTYAQAERYSVAEKPGLGGSAGSPSTLTLNNYFPKSIYRIPVSNIQRAKYPVIDAHCHGHKPLSIADMVKIMDAVGVERTVIFTGASTAERLAEVRRDYDQYRGRFDFGCLFDLRGLDRPGFGPNAIQSLEGCHRAGASQLGELSDKGRGLSSRGMTGYSSYPGFNLEHTRPPRASHPNTPMGPHADDPRLDVLWDKAAQLGMPASIHVSDPIWSYQPMDNTNDGLMNGWTWRIKLEPGMYDHNQLVNSVDKAAQKHPKTIFIACHLANLDYDLTRLGQMFDRRPNLYADIAARFAETSTIPRFVCRFLTKYSDRFVYGTDVAYDEPFFRTTFRILESEDEHFYERGILGGANNPLLSANFNYHWPLNGFGLPDNVLKNIYHDNAVNIYKKAQNNAT